MARELRSNFEPGTTRWAIRRAQWRALGLGDASKTDLLTLVVAVLLDVGLGALEDLLTLGLGLLFMTVSNGSCCAMLKVCE